MSVVRRVVSVAFSGLALVLAAGAAGAADSPTLGERAAIIERVSTEPDGTRVVLGHLSRTLQILTDELRTQREQTGLGWGELFVAHLIAKMGGRTLDQVVGEFRSGKSWEAIARDHRLNLDRLTADVSRSEDIVERRAEDRAPAVTSGGGSGRRRSTAHQSGGEAGSAPGRMRR
jgi:hypothetical protein